MLPKVRDITNPSVRRGGSSVRCNWTALNIKIRGREKYFGTCLEILLIRYFTFQISTQNGSCDVSDQASVVGRQAFARFRKIQHALFCKLQRVLLKTYLITMLYDVGRNAHT